MEERDRQGLEGVPAAIRWLIRETVTGVRYNSLCCILLFVVLFCMIDQYQIKSKNRT